MCSPGRRLLMAVLHIAPLSMLGIIGCGGTDAPTPSTIVLNPASVAFTALGQTQQLSPTVQDENGATLEDVQISWSTSSSAVASVSSGGLVTAIGVGSAEVTAAAGAANAAAEVTVAQNPTQVQKVSGDAQTGTVGQPLPQPLTVELRDALDNTITGATVNFTVTQGGGAVLTASATTDASGRASTVYTLGTTMGPNQVSAVSEVASVSVVFLATAIAGPAASVVVQAGNGQTAAPGTAVATPPTVRVTDAFGNPVSGVSVVFAVGVGDGNVTGENATTDANGVAQVGSWTLGSAGSNTLIATVGAGGITGNPVTFTATAAAGGAYNIDVRFLGSLSPAQQEAFADAEARWEGLITGDLPNVPLTTAAGDCGENSPAINETIDDLVILASVEFIDGPGATLAQAGPCYIRTTGRLTILGLMRFDEADLENVEAEGLLSAVILHEMGHVLGYGTIWADLGLLADPVLEGGTDPHFTGSQALAAFDAVGGTAYIASAKVPVEDEGDAGTADAHWRESVFRNELMTGFVDLGQNPLSRVSVASLGDMGYTINLSGADSYTLTLSLRALGTRRGLDLGNDIFQGPIRRVDARGRVTGVLRR